MQRISFFALLGAALILAAVLVLNSSSTVLTNANTKEVISASTTIPIEKKLANVDIEPQKPLATPPKVINGVYLTSWAAGTKKLVDYVIDLAANSEINAVVIDIKDYTGLIAYDTSLQAVNSYGTKELRIRKINSLIKKFHDAGIYVIARISVFQDPALAQARPDLGVRSVSKASSTTDMKKALWKDRKGLAWLDPNSHEVWEYIGDLAKDAALRGFDEINFDYVRFPSDGDLADMYFPFSSTTMTRASVIKNFFSYLRSALPETRISADLFGLSTISKGDLGIGQVIENAYRYFDFVSPMVYPSHYAPGSMGFANPADHPYEVVKNSIDSAYLRLMATSTAGAIYNSKLRPWLQDFNLGATYDAAKVSAQIKAVRDSLGANYNGFMLWNASNRYTIDALGPKINQ